MHPWAKLPLAIASEIPFKDESECFSPSSWQKLRKEPTSGFYPKAQLWKKGCCPHIYPHLSISLHLTGPSLTWALLLEPCSLLSVWTLDNDGSESQAQGAYRATTFPGCGVANSEPSSIHDSGNRAMEQPRPIRGNHQGERQRDQEVH